MSEGKGFNKLLTVLIVIAIIGIIALIIFFGWSTYNKYYLNANANEAVSDFEEYVKKDKEKQEGNQEGLEIGGLEAGSSIYNNQGTVQKYYGYEILGTISIPKINIKYPILEKASTQAIKVAVRILKRSSELIK